MEAESVGDSRSDRINPGVPAKYPVAARCCTPGFHQSCTSTAPLGIPLAICSFSGTLRRVLAFVCFGVSVMSMKCIVVTPEKTVLSQDAAFVVLPLFDGECGILLNHAPLIARLGTGELRITSPEGRLIRCYVEGGFVEVLENTIALLTMCALPEQDSNSAESATN